MRIDSGGKSPSVWKFERRVVVDCYTCRHFTAYNKDLWKTGKCKALKLVNLKPKKGCAWYEKQEEGVFNVSDEEVGKGRIR